LFDFDDFFLPTKVELNVVLHCNFIIYERKLNWYKLFRVSAVFEIGENFSESHVTITPSWNVEVLIFFNTHNRK
jgi:hypothetical protein